MDLRNTGYAVAGLALVLLSHTAIAAELIFDTTGTLTGATGVQIFIAVDDDAPDTGTTQCFDVQFSDARCGDAIPGCDGASSFVIPNGASARNAAQALLDQVFLDGPSPTPEDDYDSDPSLTRGCADSTTQCDLYVPYRKDDALDMLNQVAENAAVATSDGTAFTRGSLTSQTITDVADIDWTSTYLPTSRGSDNATWAVFTPCEIEPVPEPDALIYVIYGLVALGALSLIMSRKRRRA